MTNKISFNITPHDLRSYSTKGSVLNSQEFSSKFSKEMRRQYRDGDIAEHFFRKGREKASKSAREFSGIGSMLIPLAVLAVRVKTSCLTPFLDSLETPPSFLFKLSRLCLEALSTLISPRASLVLSTLFPPRALQVPVLPEPPFHTYPPALVFRPEKAGTMDDEPSYTPPCLLQEIQEREPQACLHQRNYVKAIFFLHKLTAAPFS